jgi:linoleoyl-CoA desaturase
MTTSKVVFEKKDPSNYFPTLRKRVQDYFTERNLSKHADWRMILKTVFILSVFASCYIVLLLEVFSPLVMLAICLLMGVFTAMIGLNIGHDAIHGAYSGNSKINRAMGLWFNIVGANDHVWRIKHNVLHHTYTNIPGHDDDINQPNLMRLSPVQKLKWYHRFQYIYLFFVYPLATLSWVFFQDFTKFFTRKLGAYDNSRYPRKEILRLFLFKAIYYVLFLVLPLTLISLPWYQVLLGFAVFHFAQGLMLTIVFQMAHLVEGVEFPIPDANGHISRSWAAHQMYTTANFSNRSRLTTFMVGALNFQIEHHLFPYVCHVHYPAIAPIVRKTAAEFGLPYVENPNLWSALRSHVRFLRKMGKDVESPSAETAQAQPRLAQPA